MGRNHDDVRGTGRTEQVVLTVPFPKRDAQNWSHAKNLVRPQDAAHRALV